MFLNIYRDRYAFYILQRQHVFYLNCIYLKERKKTVNNKVYVYIYKYKDHTGMQSLTANTEQSSVSTITVANNRNNILFFFFFSSSAFVCQQLIFLHMSM